MFDTSEVKQNEGGEGEGGLSGISLVIARRQGNVSGKCLLEFSECVLQKKT